MTLTSWIRRIEVAHTTEVNQWINYDIRPIETARRTWGYVAYHNYWLLTNTNIATYLTGSSLIPLGLTWWQAIFCIVIGNILAAVFVVLNSMPGASYHIGFPVVNRLVWGMWGSQFVIWNRIMLSLVWYGFTAYIGGECVYAIFLSWNPNVEQDISNTMPASTGMTTANFVGYIVFSVASLPFIWIRPHRLQCFFYAASSITIVFFLSFFIWALATMNRDGNGGFGSTISSASTLPKTGGPVSVAWYMVYGIMTTIGSIAAAILNQNDYTRFATQFRHATIGQAVAFPIYGILCAVIGILVTAATQNRFGGEAIWNPASVLAELVYQNPDSAGTRAAVFFAALALVVSQIGINVPGNALSGGFDLAATFPRFINIRRGAYITALLSSVVNPWKLVNTSTVFLAVLSSYSVFLGPMTGMMVAAYLLVNRRKIAVDDLYRGNSSSIYWYTLGINWRAPVAWCCGFAPLMPGFIAAVNRSVTVPDGAVKLYYLNYLYGFFASGLIFTLLHRAFPNKAVDKFVKRPTAAVNVQIDARTHWDNMDHEMTAVAPASKDQDDPV